MTGVVMDESVRELRERIFELESANARMEKVIEVSLELAEQGRPIGMIVRSLRSVQDHRRRWSPEEIVAKVHEWNDVYGQPPSALDWNPSQARKEKLQDKVDRYFAGDWPAFGTVRRHFDRWNALIAAAGFDPREPGANESRGPAHDGDHLGHLPVWNGWQLVRPLRERIALSQFALAEAAGLSESYVTTIEAGKQTNPSIRVLIALAHGLRVGPRSLVETE